FTEGGCGIDAVHCTSLLKLPQFRCSFLQYRGFCPQLFRTPKLMVWDFVGVRILRCQNLVGAGFILRRPFFRKRRRVLTATSLSSSLNAFRCPHWVVERCASRLPSAND